MSTLILTNILDALVDLVGEEAVTTVIRVAIQRTADELVTMYNIKTTNLTELAEKIREIIKKELDTDVTIRPEMNGEKIIIEVRDCKFSGSKGHAISRVSDILRRSKLCILALLCLSLIEKCMNKRYDVGSVRCEGGNAVIEILSPELYLRK
ncbi:MAG: hypothetical protein GXO23_02185 [Crenarchaeota archaeon]|nr:hypothetical protein [Thermoproteota archaeon]